MRRIQSTRALLLAAALTSSCLPILAQAPYAFASTTADSPRVLETTASDERAVVLLNLRGSIDRKSVTSIGSPVSNDVFAVYLASLDELSAPKQAEPHRLDKRAAAGGWHAWLLRPGLYYLLILPPGLGQNPPAAAYHVPSGRFGRLTRYEFAPGMGGAGLDPWATVHGTGQAFMVYNLLAATFELAQRAKEKRQAEEAAARLGPCMQRLGASLDQAGYRAALVQSLEQAAAARGIAVKRPGEGETPAAESGYLLSANAPMVRLVAGGGPEMLSLDLVVDLRLYGAADRKLRYVSLLSFGPEFRPLSPFIDRSPLYLRRVETRPPPRAVAEWCGESGPV